MEQTLSPTLERYLQREGNTTESRRKGVLRFIHDLYDFLHPELLLLEDTSELFPSSQAWSPLLPNDLRLLLHKPRRPELAIPVQGAFLYARRLLWDHLAGLTT